MIECFSSGRQLFEELDGNKDGRVSLGDLEIATGERRVPKINKCHEASSAVPVSRPAEPLAQSVLKSALAGGIACSFSAFMMHPLDTFKTCVQASTLSFPEIIAKLQELGFQGLYKGSIPAVLGMFTSHGLRNGLCEVSKSVLTKAAPGLPDIQVQSLASFCSTALGTTYRIPFEVLKQRLQAGIYDNVGEATIVTLRQDGIKGFYRGTGATLSRELTFYVLGMALYGEAKKAMQRVLRRDLGPWETVVVGGLTGGLVSILTTPLDVIKTRMMIAPQGMQITMQMAAITILRKEGPLAFFRGALPRFFRIAPSGAINFAGYELLRKTMDRAKFFDGEQQSKMRIAGTT
ncbi:S-adenosylmethionine mitochondrial carrier protein-like isoform X2 [Asparagus officinalis]|uniref:S-adenosylmethionine mitochondrial carrier protein-like isoform X2 n=1 Tax=Asparagus officinalis TaxID=4686 RepID=UPI00098DF18D|nr:S-adenosylmethionine mitochondrial carrier protein-like isoform X2 [Asparagus officinalis]